MTARIALLVALLFGAQPGPAAPAEEGLVLERVRELRVSGRVVDSRTGQPLQGALVTVEGPYQNRRAETGPDGTYFVGAGAEDGLGTVSIAFAHAEYQQKYLETLFRDAFPGKVEAEVSGPMVTVKGKRVKLALRCGQGGTLPMRAGAAQLTTVCEQGLFGVSVEIRGNRVAVLAREPFTLRIEEGRLEVRETQATAVELRVDAAMLPR